MCLTVSKQSEVATSLAPLDVARLAEAFPLVSDYASGVTLEEWKTYAARVGAAGDRAHILCFDVGGGILRGLCICRIEPNLQDAQTLVVNDLIIGDSMFRRAATIALLRAIERHANGVGCAAVALDVPVSVHWLAECAAEHGFLPNSTRLAKPVDRGA
jgi:hypothetical protein